MKPTIEKSRMNDLECRYSLHLESLKIDGEIIDYVFEPFELILVHAIPKIRRKMIYRPDFLVVRTDRFEIHEVKGPHWYEDARVKVKIAAELFPWFKFIAIQDYQGQWDYEFFN